MLADLDASGTELGVTSIDPAWTCSAGNQVVQCDHPGPVLGDGSLAPVTVTGVPGRTFDGGEVTLFAEVEGEFDGNRTNDFDSLDFTLQSPVDLSIDVDDADASSRSPDPAPTTSSSRTSATAAATQPTTVHSSGLLGVVTDVQTSPASWECSEDFFDLVCTTDDQYAAGASSTLTVSFTVAPTGSDTLSVSGSVENAGDGRYGNDNDFEQTPLVAVADVVVSVDDGDATFTAPGTGQYDVVVSNTKSVDADGPVHVDLSVFGPAVLVDGSGTGWGCIADLGSLACTHDGPVPGNGSLPTLTVDASVTVSPTRALNIFATVSAPSDANLANNQDSDTTPISVPADFAVTLQRDEPRCRPRDPARWTSWSSTSAPARRSATSPSRSPVGSAPRRPSTVGTATRTTASSSACTPARSRRAPPCRRSRGRSRRHSRNDPPCISPHRSRTRATVSPPTTRRSSTCRWSPLPISPCRSSTTPSWSSAAPRRSTSWPGNVGTAASAGTVVVTLPHIGTAPSGDGWDCTDTAFVYVCTHEGDVAAGTELPPIAVLGDHREPRATTEPAPRPRGVANDSDGNTENNETSADVPVKVAVDLVVEITPHDPPFVTAATQRTPT